MWVDESDNPDWCDPSSLLRCRERNEARKEGRVGYLIEGFAAGLMVAVVVWLIDHYPF